MLRTKFSPLTITKNSIGQGTIEYLVIVGVVVVLSLVVVALVVNLGSAPSQQILSESEKLSNIGGGGIVIVEAVSDFEDSGFVVLRNYSSGNVVLTRIGVEGDSYDYSNEFIGSTGEKIFGVKDLCVCGKGEIKKTCEFEFFYLTQSGLEKKEKKSVTVNCTNKINISESEGKNKIIEPLPPFTFKINVLNTNYPSSILIFNSKNMQINWGLEDKWENIEDFEGGQSITKQYLEKKDYNISLRGTANKIIINTIYQRPGSQTPVYKIMDIYYPLSNSVTGLTSTEGMFEFGEFSDDYFSCPEWFDETSKNITNMSKMFKNAKNFNQPINSWNTSNVTDMSEMFSGAFKFNQPIGSWNTSKVNNMKQMFYNAKKFNQDISDWNTSKVENTNKMFALATNFNQPLNSWNTSNVTNMEGMFSDASDFNQNINSWNTSSVTNMSYMFSGATNFNQPLNDWNTINVTKMNHMFYDSNFNQNINKWDTNNVTTMDYMFYNAKKFNKNISNWNVEKINACFYIFENCPIEQTYKPPLTCAQN